MTDEELAKRIYLSTVRFNANRVEATLNGRYSLMELFTWSNTIEGFKFWADVFYHKLRTAKELQQFMLVYYSKKGFIDLNSVI